MRLHRRRAERDAEFRRNWRPDKGLRLGGCPRLSAVGEGCKLVGMAERPASRPLDDWSRRAEQICLKRNPWKLTAW